MKIPFEKFFEEHENDFPESAIDLFKESVLCYKVGANRSAFLMALNGFHIIIVDRLINSSIIPQTYNPHDWQKKLNELNDDDNRDKILKGLIETEDNSKKVLLISKQTIREYKCLRDIRNICAHGKSGVIDTYRVEQIWAFIQRNLASFTINGGKDYLLEKIREHYDTRLTAPNKNPKYLVNDVIKSLPSDEYQDFLSSLYKLTKHNPPFGYGFDNRNNMMKFWKLLLQNKNFHDVIVNFIKDLDDITITDDFVTVFPETVSEIISDESFSRLLWTEKVFDTLSPCEGKWLLFREIVEKNIIPDSEKNEFYEKLYKRVGKFFPIQHVDILKKTDYFKRLYEDLFESCNFRFIGIRYLNREADSIENYLKVFPLTLGIVNNFNEAIPMVDWGNFYRMLKRWFADKSNFEAYKKIVLDNNLEDLSGKFIDNPSEQNEEEND